LSGVYPAFWKKVVSLKAYVTLPPVTWYHIPGYLNPQIIRLFLGVFYVITTAVFILQQQAEHTVSFTEVKWRSRCSCFQMGSVGNKLECKVQDVSCCYRTRYDSWRNTEKRTKVVNKRITGSDVSFAEN
jgi:hypothetical protein